MEDFWWQSLSLWFKRTGCNCARPLKMAEGKLSLTAPLPSTSWCKYGPRTLITFYWFISCFKIISMINIGMNISFVFKLILFLKGELYVFTYMWTLKTKQTIITKQKQTQIQAPLSMGFCRQEYWSGSSFLSSGSLPNTEGSNLCLLCLLHYRRLLPI